MTRPSKRELEKELEALAENDGGPGIAVVSGQDSDEYPTPAEFEQRHGQPLDAVNGLVIRVPPKAEEF